MGQVVKVPETINAKTKDWQNALNRITYAMADVFALSFTNMDNDNLPALNAGSFIGINHTIFTNINSENFSGWEALPIREAQRSYLYVEGIGTEATFFYSVQAPVQKTDLGGYYHNTRNARCCISFLKTAENICTDKKYMQDTFPETMTDYDKYLLLGLENLRFNADGVLITLKAGSKIEIGDGAIFIIPEDVTVNCYTNDELNYYSITINTIQDDPQYTFEKIGYFSKLDRKLKNGSGQKMLNILIKGGYETKLNSYLSSDRVLKGNGVYISKIKYPIVANPTGTAFYTLMVPYQSSNAKLYKSTDGINFNVIVDDPDYWNFDNTYGKNVFCYYDNEYLYYGIGYLGRDTIDHYTYLSVHRAVIVNWETEQVYKLAVSATVRAPIYYTGMSITDTELLNYLNESEYTAGFHVSSIGLPLPFAILSQKLYYVVFYKYEKAYVYSTGDYPSYLSFIGPYEFSLLSKQLDGTNNTTIINRRRWLSFLTSRDTLGVSGDSIVGLNWSTSAYYTFFGVYPTVNGYMGLYKTNDYIVVLGPGSVEGGIGYASESEIDTIYPNNLQGDNTKVPEFYWPTYSDNVSFVHENTQLALRERFADALGTNNCKALINPMIRWISGTNTYIYDDGLGIDGSTGEHELENCNIGKPGGYPGYLVIGRDYSITKHIFKPAANRYGSTQAATFKVAPYNVTANFTWASWRNYPLMLYTDRCFVTEANGHLLFNSSNNFTTYATDAKNGTLLGINGNFYCVGSIQGIGTGPLSNTSLESYTMFIPVVVMANYAFKSRFRNYRLKSSWTEIIRENNTYVSYQYYLLFGGYIVSNSMGTLLESIVNRNWNSGVPEGFVMDRRYHIYIEHDSFLYIMDLGKGGLNFYFGKLYNGGVTTLLNTNVSYLTYMFYDFLMIGSMQGTLTTNQQTTMRIASYSHYLSYDDIYDWLWSFEWFFTLNYSYVSNVDSSHYGHYQINSATFNNYIRSDSDDNRWTNYYALFNDYNNYLFRTTHHFDTDYNKSYINIWGIGSKIIGKFDPDINKAILYDEDTMTLNWEDTIFT